MAIANETFHSVKGSSEIIPLPETHTWDLADGTQTFKEFAGTKAAILQKFRELAAAGADSGVDALRDTYNGQSGRLSCRVIDDSGGADGGNTEAVNAIWELIANDILKPIETHSDFDSIAADRKREIENYVRSATDYPATLSGAAELSLAGYYAYQVLDFPLTELLLRKSIVVSSRSTITAAYAYMNRCVAINADQLIANIGPPSALLGVLTSLPLMSGADGAWQWLKKAPQVRQVGKRKFQIMYEWWGTERWAGIYGGSWFPTYA